MAERLRIVEVNPYFYPFRGGIEHRIHNISKRLAARHDVFILTSQLEGTSATERMDSYEVMRLPSKYRGNYNPPYVSTLGLMDALKGLKPDIVNFHYRWAPTYNKLAKEYDGAKVFTFHNTFGEGAGITRLPSWANDQLWKRHLKKFGTVVCISEFIRNDLVARGLDPSRLVTIPNGVDMPDGSIRSEEKDFILFVGRLVGTKGLPYLIRAMKDVDTRLIICGAGPEEASLKKLTSKLDLCSKISFEGRVSEERKMQVLASCKLFVMPSIFESYGIAVAEAMSYGKAIVASDVGGLPEVVRDAGLLSEPKDPCAIATNINNLLTDDRLRASMAAKAAEYAPSYDWNGIALRTEQLYRTSV